MAEQQDRQTRPIPPGPEGNAARWPLVHEGVLSNPHEGFVIGNGDLAAGARVLSHELLLTLGKGDVWDARVPTTTEEGALKHDDLLRSGGYPEAEPRNRPLTSTDYVQKSRPGPSPKRAGLVRLTHPGLSDTRLRTTLDIARGVLTVEYGFRRGRLTVESFVHRRRNCLLMRLSARGEVPWMNISLEKTPDFARADIPPARLTAAPDDGRRVISQTIPAGDGVADFTWHLAGSFPHAGQCSMVWGIVDWPHAVREDVRLADGESVVFAVGVATDRDGPGSVARRALALAGEAEPERYGAARAEHEEAWARFWQASAVELEDKELEALWYRSMYGFACHLKRGAQAPGLNANIPPFDFSAWNGFYTWNHNVQKWYFPALAVNHPEWYDVLADLIGQHMPVFEYLADLIFGLDGAYCDLMTAPFAPPQRARTHSEFGRALAHTGWLAMMLFQHYEYTGDAHWLRTRAYPCIRRSATFYANYLDKYQDESGDIFPSIRLEDSGWHEGFVGNRNVVTDLVMFRKAFEVALRASEVLAADEPERDRWREGLERVPEIEYGRRDGRAWYALCKDWEEVWPDFDEYLDHLRHSRWGCAGWLVFPGEHVEGDEQGGLAAVVREALAPVDLLSLPDRTRQLGTFHGESVVTPFVRMRMMSHFGQVRTLLLSHTFAAGHFSPYATGEGVYVRQPHCFSWRIVENQYFPILAVTEMLLQSQGGVLRLFPFWPEGHPAAFRALGGRGGFVVSARREADGALRATIRSGCGNDCRLRWEREGLPEVSADDRPVPCRREGRDIVFPTDAGGTYTLTAG